MPLNGGLLVVTLGLLILLAACNGASGSISVSLNPTTATVTPNQTVTFTASVTGASNPDVTWAATCGTITGTGNSVTYTAPASAATCTVTVTSVSDSSKTATATVQVQASTGSIAGMNIPSAVVATVTQIFGQLPDAQAGGTLVTLADLGNLEPFYDEVADVYYLRPISPWLPGTIDSAGAFAVEFTGTPEPGTFGMVLCEFEAESPTAYTILTHDGPLESSATEILGVYARMKSDLDLPDTPIDSDEMLQYAPMAWQVFLYSAQEEHISCRGDQGELIIDVDVILAPGWNSLWAIMRPEMVDGAQRDHGYIRSTLLADLDAEWVPLVNIFAEPD